MQVLAELLLAIENNENFCWPDPYFCWPDPYFCWPDPKTKLNVIFPLESVSKNKDLVSKNNGSGQQKFRKMGIRSALILGIRSAEIGSWSLSFKSDHISWTVLSMTKKTFQNPKPEFGPIRKWKKEWRLCSKTRPLSAFPRSALNEGTGGKQVKVLL